MKKIKIFTIFLAIFILWFVVDFNYIIYSKFYYKEHEIKNSSLNLHNYRVEIEAKQIKQIKKNLSGLTYNKNTNRLFAITNSPRDIYELTLEGDVLRKIKLKNFKDTEGIVHIKENLYAVIEERKSKVSLVKIDKDTKVIDKNDILNSFKFEINIHNNLGYEGIAYNKQKDTLFIVNEKFPMKLIKVYDFVDNTINNISHNNLDLHFDNHFITEHYFVDDYAGLHFEENLNHLLFLSEESKLIAEVTLDGKQISFVKLEKGFLGLKNDIPQAEGITMDKDKNLYIVSEPNLFYSFKAK